MASASSSTYAAPAVFDKIVVAGGRDKRLHGIDRITGKGLWELRMKDRVDSSAVIRAGNTAVVGSDDGYVYVVDLATGKDVWKYEIGAPVRHPPRWPVTGSLSVRMTRWCMRSRMPLRPRQWAPAPELRLGGRLNDRVGRIRSNPRNESVCSGVHDVS